MFATPHRRLICWSVASWLIVRELQVLLTVLTLTGSFGQRVSAWDFFDAKFYVFLAQHGYLFGHTADSVFFPGYPLVGHLLLIGPIPPLTIMLLVSNLAALAALILVGLFVYYETMHEQAAIWAVLLLAVSPLGVFLSAPYADSLFLALAAGALWAARSGHWRIAGIVLALAVITRPFGAALAVTLLLEYLRQHQQWRHLPWLVAPSIVTGGGWLLVLWRVFGSPFAVFSSESHFFSHTLMWPWQALWLVTQQIAAAGWTYDLLHILLDLLPVLGCLLCVILLARKWPASFTVYLCTVALLCLITPIIYPHGAQDALASDGRYVYAAAPLLLIPLGWWLTHWPRGASSAVLAASFVLQIGLTAFVLHGGWLV